MGIVFLHKKVMKKFIQIFASCFLFFACDLSGSVLEHLDFRKDGSGTYKITLDLIKSRRILKIIDKLDKNNQNAQVFLYNAFTETCEKISRIHGITNANLTYDTHMTEFSISFEFKNLRALNRALSTISKMDDRGNSISWQNDKFVRKISSVDKIFKHNLEDDGNIEALLGFKLFFKKIKYIIVYTFEHKKIRPPTTGYTMLSENHNSITYECFFVDRDTSYNQTIFLS